MITEYNTASDASIVMTRQSESSQEEERYIFTTGGLMIARTQQPCELNLPGCLKAFEDKRYR